MTYREMRCPCGESDFHCSYGMERITASLRNHGAKYSMFGAARTSLREVRCAAVPGCAGRGRSPNLPVAGHSVLSFIHSGSSRRFGIGCREFCVPGICRVGPFSGVRSTIGKLMVTAGTGSSRSTLGPSDRAAPTTRCRSAALGTRWRLAWRRRRLRRSGCSWAIRRSP